MGRPSIAVLPLRPLGTAPELRLLGEAIPHEIIEALSRLRWLAVIARGSSFRFGPGIDRDVTAAVLDARYLLSGVVEADSRKITVTIELTEAGTREVLWADRLAAAPSETDHLRERIVAHLVAALETHIPFHEASIALSRGPEGMDAWANYYLGLRHLYRFTASDTACAREHFTRAAAADPRFARAEAGLSFTSFLEAFLRLGIVVGRFLGDLLKEIAHRHVQHVGKLVQPAGDDAVRAALVLLHLLEGDADHAREALLAQPHEHAPLPQALTDVHVDRVGFHGGVSRLCLFRCHRLDPRSSWWVLEA